MKLSSNEEYGLRCLLRLGYEGPGGSLTLPEISQAEGVSEAYAAKIMRILRRGGFVKSARGKIGGYTLARPAAEIVVGDVSTSWAAAFSKATSATGMPARWRPAPTAAWTARYDRSGRPCRW